MEPLKEMFNQAFYEKLASEFFKAYKPFDKKKFLNEVSQGLKELELNQRMRQTSIVLKSHLPNDYKKSIAILKDVIPNMYGGYTNLLFPDFVGLHGKGDVKISLEALKYFTQFGSSEFAIREFLRLDFDSTIKELYQWAKDRNYHVRRLASEGSRPRLPWSFKLDRVIKDPKLTLPILEQLKEDSELYVRKSVANHLNDFSKEHPKLLLDIVKRWKGNSPHTDWIIKHGSRTLLKRGDANILGHFGIKHNPAVVTKSFGIVNTKIKTGESLTFHFTLENKSTKIIPIRMEYALYFRIANGSLSKKVFKISERSLEGKGVLEMEKKHSFKLISTRKYYAGVQKVALIINGKESEALAFNLSLKL